MLERRHWLKGSSLLPLLQEAIENVERTITDRLDRRGELERPEDRITTILTESLRVSLDTVAQNLRDLQNTRHNQPAVSNFNFSICDMRDVHKDVLGADIAFIFRANWPNEFETKRGILVQAKRLGRVSQRTLNRLDRELNRLFGLSLEEWNDIIIQVGLRPPVLRRMRTLWPFVPELISSITEESPLGEFLVDENQLDEILQVVSSYYMFYDYPLPHLSLPCIQALTVKGLVSGVGNPELSRPSILRHSFSLTQLLVDEFVGCRIGEWNENFEQLGEIADQNRVGGIATTKGEYNVDAYNVRFVVVLEAKLLPSPYEQKG